MTSSNSQIILKTEGQLIAEYANQTASNPQVGYTRRSFGQPAHRHGRERANHIETRFYALW